MAEKKKIKAQPVTPPALPPSSDSPMDPRLLEQLVKLMSEHGLSEINVREGSKRVSLKRGFAAPVSTVHAPVYAPAPTASPTPAATSKADDNAGLVPIKSPMVGTFYSASGPDAKAFVNVGSVVDEDSDVCIIEAMKVFNNIKAETRGTIAKICVTNGQAVEFGTVLFLVKP